MGLINSILKNFSSKPTEEELEIIKKDIQEVFDDFEKSCGCYITLNELDEILQEWEIVYKKIKNIRIPKNSQTYHLLEYFKKRYKVLNKEVEESNQEYMENERISCRELLENIDGKALDLQQQNVVVSNDDRTLVLAGAGSGKTLTIAGKVKYLCEQEGVKPEDILLIAFTQKSAEEITERISGNLSIPIVASTFHKLGLGIITDATGKRPDVLDDVNEFIKEYFEKYISNNPKDVKNIIKYFAYYMSIPKNIENFSNLGELYDYEKALDLETIKSKYDRCKYIEKVDEEKKENRVTLKNEKVKSLEEVIIANFLFLNGIEYEYEIEYPFKSDDPKRKKYRPDFYLKDYYIF